MILIPFRDKHLEFNPTKIIGVARNYPAHAQEMGMAVPTQPGIFLKPPSALIGDQGEVVIPDISKRTDHEVELGVIIKKRCKRVDAEDAWEFIFGYTVIVDVTARDIQAEAKRAGMPWTTAKGFDTFAPVGPRIVPADEIDPSNLDIWLKVNGVYRQRSNTQYMIFSIPDLISFISSIMTLEPMDIIATGTPEGVGPLHPLDFVEAGIEGIGTLRFRVK